MRRQYSEPHAHRHEWALEPSIEVDEDVWVRFPCNYWEGETYTDDARDETYTRTDFECEARKILVYELSFEVGADRRVGRKPLPQLGKSPSDCDTTVEAPREAVEHVYTKCEDELRERFEPITDPDDAMKGFSFDIDGVRVVAELRDSYVEDY